MFILLILVVCSLLVENVSPSEDKTMDAITEGPKDNKLSNEMLLSIIDDIVHSKSKKIYHTIYNLNQNTSICFKDYIYMKEDNINGESLNTWREFEFTFDYPGYCCNETNTNDTSGDNERFKTVSVVFENGDRKQLPFEIFEQSSDYTIRRNVRVYCMSRLSVLDKRYFESGNSDQKKIVIKMSDTDEHHGDVVTVIQDQDKDEEFFSHRRDHNRDDEFDDKVYEIKRAPKVQKIGKARINSVFSEVPDWYESTSTDNSSVINTSPLHNSDDKYVDNETLSNKDYQSTKSSSELKPESFEVNNIDESNDQSNLLTSWNEINGVTAHNQSDNRELHEILLTNDHINADNNHLGASNNDQPSSLVNENIESIKAAHSGASILSKLLSGKWVLSSMIDLGDDKIVVRGDITVMRKHQYSNNITREENFNIQ